MTWNSGARHTPRTGYAQIEGTPEGAEYDILPAVGTGKKVYFGVGQIAAEEAFYTLGLGLDYQSIPIIRCMNCGGENGATIAASVLLHVVTADDKEYLIGMDDLEDDFTSFKPEIGSIILQEGERIRLTVGSVVGNPVVEATVPYAEVNGPVVTRRVILNTEDWQDLIPAPRPGKVNVFVGNDVSRPGLAFLTEDGTDEALAELRRRENGSTVAQTPEEGGVEFDDGIVNMSPSRNVLSFENAVAFIGAEIRAGQSLQGRIEDFDGNGDQGKLVCVSYLEIDEDAF